jgi:hypothetical protein
MIEEIFLQYGAIGACFLVCTGFFYKYYTDTKTFQGLMRQVVENNTIALTKVYEVVSKCPAKRKL